MSPESVSQPGNHARAPAREPSAAPEMDLNFPAKAVACVIVALGFVAILYFDIPKIVGLPVAFVTATLAGALAHRLTKK